LAVFVDDEDWQTVLARPDEANIIRRRGRQDRIAEWFTVFGKLQSWVVACRELEV
jgi:hypothetical protein